MRGAAAFVDRGRRTTRMCYNLYSIVAMLTTRNGPAVIYAKARYWSKIASTEYTNVSYVTDRQTDTTRRHRPR